MVEEKQMKTVKVAAAIICDDMKEKIRYSQQREAMAN